MTNSTSHYASRLGRLLIALALLWICLGAPAKAQPDGQGNPTPNEQLAPEVASYQMDVRLDPAAKTVHGAEWISYTNPSGDTLTELWLHLYLKAFSSLNTTWMRESGGQHRAQQVEASALGDINLEKLTLANGVDLLATATFSETLVQVPLPQPLAPGQKIELEATWTSKLPRVFARTGYGGRDNTFFMVGQWYPKMAVYDRRQWDTLPWHANSEFFHDFGRYDVRITLPQEYVVAGVGVPAGEVEAGNGLKIVRFTATGVTDFAFAASPDFQITQARAREVEVVLYYLPEHADFVADYLQTGVGALQSYSDWYGPYPHPRLTIVDVPDNAQGAGGMEYPTFVTGGTQGIPAWTGTLAVVASHEIAHQWWPMQTATHEGREPWLDEGLTEYSGMRYLAEMGRGLGVDPLSLNVDTPDRLGYNFTPAYPANLPAWEYDETVYGGPVYNKTALGLWTLERLVGTERFRRAMADYLAAWRFKHPTAADFRTSLEQSLAGEDLTWFFDDFIAGKGVIDYAVGAIQNTTRGSTVEIRRQGAVRVPVEVRLTFDSGAQQIMVWDGQAEHTHLTFPAIAPVVQVQVDPERKLVAELDIADNGAGTKVQVGPTLILGGRLMFWLQSFLSLLGLFG